MNPPAAPPRWVRRNSALFVAYTVGQTSTLYWPYMFHLVTAVRGLSATEFGVLKSIYYATTVVLELPLGVVADRFGRRTSLILSAGLNIAACLAYASARTFLEFAAAEVLMAVGSALHSGADSALLFDSLKAGHRQDDYAKIHGRARAAAYGTLVVGLPVADALLVRGGDPTATYVATAALAGIGLLAALAMREPPGGGNSSSLSIIGDAVRKLRSSPALIRVIVYGTGLYLLVRAAGAAYYNPVLAWKGVPVERYGTLFAVLSVFGAYAAARIHVWKLRIGYGRIIVVMPALLLAMYGMLAIVPGPGAALLFILAGGVAGIVPIVTSDLVNRMAASEHRATVLSFQSLAWRGSYAVVAVFIGWSLDGFSTRTALLLGAAVCALPLVLQLAIRTRTGGRPALVE